MVSDQIIKVLDELGKRLVGPAQKLWEIYVKQAYVDGIQFIIASMAIWGVAYWCYRLYKWGTSNDEGDAVVWGAIFTVAFSVGAVLMICAGVGHFINPEYYALMDIIQSITGNKI